MGENLISATPTNLAKFSHDRPRHYYVGAPTPPRVKPEVNNQPRSQDLSSSRPQEERPWERGWSIMWLNIAFLFNRFAAGEERNTASSDQQNGLNNMKKNSRNEP